MISINTLFEEAVMFHQSGQLANAEPLYREIFKRQPDHPAANQNVGMIALQVGQADAGFPYLCKAMAEWLRRLNYSEAEILGQVMTRHYPDNVFGWKCLAIALNGVGKPRESLAVMRVACTCDPADATLQFNLGVMLAQEGSTAEAAQSYQAALIINPRYADAHFNLGNLYRGERKFSAAEKCFRAVREYKPDHMPGLLNLGVTLEELGNLSEAEITYKSVLGIDSHNTSAMCNLGNLLSTLEKFQEAESWYSKALAVDPKLNAIRIGLGRMMSAQARQVEALEEFRKALENDPNCDTAYVCLAMTLRDMNDLNQAEEICNIGVKRIPDSLSLRTTLVVLMIDMGKFKEAQTSIDQILARDPYNVNALALIASTRRMMTDDQAWERRVQDVLRQPMELHLQSELRFALGKYFDDLGEYENAFQEYSNANKIKRSFSPVFDFNRLEMSASRVINSHTTEVIHKQWLGASESERPVFIVGMPRSGTSLIEQILASHPAIHGAGELLFWQKTAVAHSASSLDGIYSEEMLQKITQDCLENLNKQSKYSSNILRIIDKFPENYLYLGLIHSAFPHARIIHMMRNPIDTCLSIYFQNFNVLYSYASSLDDLARYYRQYHRTMKHWRSVLPSYVLLEVPYEELVDDQEGWCHKMIDFIGLDWDVQCLEYYKTERSIGTASNWQARQPIYKTSKERWRNYEKYISPLIPLLELYDPTLGVQ